MTVDRLPAIDTADRSASRTAPASTKALPRIGMGKLMGVFLLVRQRRDRQSQLSFLDIVAAPSGFAEMTKK
jgi:hypothetical protein